MKIKRFDFSNFFIQGKVYKRYILVQNCNLADNGDFDSTYFFWSILLIYTCFKWM